MVTLSQDGEQRPGAPGEWPTHYVVLENVEFNSVGGFKSCLLAVERSAGVYLRGCRFTGSDHNGVNVTCGSRVVMEDCVVTHCRGAGVFVDDRSHVTLVNCDVSRNGRGVVASGAGTVVTVQGRGTRVCGNATSGVVAGRQAQVFLRNGTVSGNGLAGAGPPLAGAGAAAAGAAAAGAAAAAAAAPAAGGREKRGGWRKRRKDAYWGAGLGAGLGVAAPAEAPRPAEAAVERSGGLLAESLGTLVLGRYGGAVPVPAGARGKKKAPAALRDGYVPSRAHGAPYVHGNLTGVMNVGGTVELSDGATVLSSPVMSDSLIEVVVPGTPAGRWSFGPGVHLQPSDIDMRFVAGEGGEGDAARGAPLGQVLAKTAGGKGPGADFDSEGDNSEELDPSNFAPRNTRLSAGNTKAGGQFGRLHE